MEGLRPRHFAASSQSARSESKQRARRSAKKNSSKRARRRNLGAAIESLENRNLLTFAIDLFQDINVLGVSSNVDEVVQVGNEAFFVADDGLSGSELWKTDGTASGTSLVKDILPGPDTSDPRDLTVVGDEVFFTALDEDGEIDLWKSDGTESGTVMVMDADAGGIYGLGELTESGGNLFFTAYDSSFSYELWISDGTTAGTVLVDDLGVFESPRELTDVNGTLFFSSYESGYDNRELWKSDGTSAGTMMVADLSIDPGVDGMLGTADDDPLVSSDPSNLTNVDGVLYFTADDFEDGIELYKSDGTAGGTVRIADLNPTGSSEPRELTQMGTDVFFSATDGTGRHLYKTDGTSITFVVDTTDGMGVSNPVSLEAVGNTLYFGANGIKQATTISAASPTMTADNSRLFSSGYAGIVAEVTDPDRGSLAGFGGSVTFTATDQGDPDDGNGWVAADAEIGDPGVGLSTLMVGDLYVEDIDGTAGQGGPGGDLQDDSWVWTIADPAGLTNINFSGFASGNEFNSSDEGLLFEMFINGSETPAHTTTVFGDALDNWFADRDADNINLPYTGTEIVTEVSVRLSIGNSTFPNMPSGGNEAFVVGATLTADLSPFTAVMQDAGRELHKTDGTAAGTSMVKDIVPNGSSNPFQLTNVDGTLFFAADDVFGTGLELWTSDGTESGTMLVVDSLPGNDLYGAPLDGAPELFGSINGELLFSTSGVGFDRELWISDGTPLGTDEVADINPSTEDAFVRDLVDYGTNLYFVADDGINGDAVWRADTIAGTATMLADVSPASTDRISSLRAMPGAGEDLIFYSNTLGTSGGVYVLNASGTLTQVSTLQPAELDSDGTMFVVVGSNAFFVADDGVSGNELYRVSGSNQAILVNDLIPGSTGSDPMELTEFNGLLYFSADTSSASTTGDIGRELFSTDGFTITNVSDNIRTGPNSSSPEDLTVAGTTLYFSANNGSGRGLWYVSQFFPVPSFVSGSGDSDPFNLTDVNGTLYFAAEIGSTGIEPYSTFGFGVTSLGDLNPGSGDSIPSGFFSALGTIFFAADNGTDGNELWKTNGSSSGTVLVADIQPGGSSDPVPLIEATNRMIFSAAGTTDIDRELWATDGASTTLLVQDLYPPEFYGSFPEELVEINGRIYFAASTGRFGRELYVMEEVSPAVLDVMIGGVPGMPVAEDSRSNVDLVTVVFEGYVDVPTSAVQVVNRDTGVTVSSAVANVWFDSFANKTYVEITFGSGPSVIDRDPGSSTGALNSLADGNYVLTLQSAGVTSPVSGVPMADDFVFGDQATDEFFRFLGDSDGDRDVDAQDFGRFAQTLQQPSSSAGFDDRFDFDGDGDVDGIDYAQLQRSFLRKLPF